MRNFLAASALLVCFSAAASAANEITGAVRNQTRGEPAAGDAVLLVRVDAGMSAEARAKTNAHGEFTLAVQHPGTPYLVRVHHQGVNYDQQASTGDVLRIEVFDAAPLVRGISGTVEILRAGTNGNSLHVSDMVEIQNTSSPPITQAGLRTFEMYLPPNAKIDSVLAAGPGKKGEFISATPVSGQPGHYTVGFPLRPGATKFAFNYDVPYFGRVTFHSKLAFPMQQLAVMIPSAMILSSRSQAFENLPTGSRYQAWAASRVKAGEELEFEVSGTGTLPPLSVRDRDQLPPQSTPLLPPALAASSSVLPPLAARTASTSKLAQPPSQSLVLGVLTSIFLAACTLLLWRGRKARNFSAQPNRTRRPQRQRSIA